METNWEEIEENQEIKQEFADYKSGLMRHSQERLVLTPGTVKMLSEYQVSLPSSSLPSLSASEDGGQAGGRVGGVLPQVRHHLDPGDGLAGRQQPRPGGGQGHAGREVPLP